MIMIAKRGALVRSGNRVRDRVNVLRAPFRIVETIASHLIARTTIVVIAGLLFITLRNVQAQEPPAATAGPIDADAQLANTDQLAHAPVGRLSGAFYVGASDVDPLRRETDASATGVGVDLAGWVSERTRL